MGPHHLGLLGANNLAVLRRVVSLFKDILRAVARDVALDRSRHAPRFIA
jgi:hypothetical protein